MADPEFTRVMKNSFTVNVSACLESQYVLKFNPELKWNTYIRSIAKGVVIIAVSFIVAEKKRFLAVSFISDIKGNVYIAISG